MPWHPSCSRAPRGWPVPGWCRSPPTTSSTVGRANRIRRTRRWPPAQPTGAPRRPESGRCAPSAPTTSSCAPRGSTAPTAQASRRPWPAWPPSGISCRSSSTRSVSPPGRRISPTSSTGSWRLGHPPARTTAPLPARSPGTGSPRRSCSSWAGTPPWWPRRRRRPLRVPPPARPTRCSRMMRCTRPASTPLATGPSDGAQPPRTCSERSGSCLGRRDALRVLEQGAQVGAVAGLAQRLGALGQLSIGEEALPPGHLLRTAELESLARLHGPHEVRRIGHRVEGAGVEPGRPARQHLHVQVATLQVHPVDVGDLILAARRRREVSGNLYDIVVIEVHPRYCERALRLCRLFLD